MKNKSIRLAVGALTALSFAAAAVPAQAASAPSNVDDRCGPVASSVKVCTALDGWIYQMSVNKAVAGPRPGIGGAPVAGNTLTVFDGVWNPASAKLTHQWLRNDVPILGANGTTYKLTKADAGKGIRVKTTGSATGYKSATVQSAKTAPVTAAAGSLPTVTPSSKVGIGGIPTMYNVITATTYKWATPGIQFAYQWTRDDVPIPGATDARYQIIRADSYRQIRVAVTGYAAGFEPVTLVSPPKMGGSFLTQSDPISGTPEPGRVLTVGYPVVEGSRTTLQWLRDGIEIAGATANSYKVTEADRGSVLVMRTGTTETWGDHDPTVYSLPLLVPGKPAVQLPLTNVALPVLSGEARLGKTMSVTPGTWSVPDKKLTISYRWSANGQVLINSDTPTYTPAGIELGKALSVTVAASAPGYKTTKVTVAAPGLVAEADPEFVSGVTVYGTPTVGRPIKVSDPYFGPTYEFDPNLKNTYQWRRAGTPIPGATAATYTPVGADAGKVLSVAVSSAYKGRIFHTQTAQPYRSVVVAGKLVTAMPTVTGTPKAGSVLTLKPGAWTAGTRFTYVWLRNGVPISNAAAATYKVRTADKGAKLTVRVTGTQLGYEAVTRDSAAFLVR